MELRLLCLLVYLCDNYSCHISYWLLITKNWSSSTISNINKIITHNQYTNNNTYFSNPKNTNPKSTDTLIHWYSDTLILWYTDTLIPWYPDTLIPWYRYVTNNGSHQPSYIHRILAEIYHPNDDWSTDRFSDSAIHRFIGSKATR